MSLKDYFIVFIAVIFILSCSQDNMDSKKVEKHAQSINNLVTSSSQDSVNYKFNRPLSESWQEYVQNIFDDDGVVALNSQGLKLLSYKELNDDQSRINAILKQPFSNESRLPITSQKLNEAVYFKLFTVATLNKNGEQPLVDMHSKRKKLMIEHYRKLSPLQVVRLNWNYKGQTFHTDCLVNKKTIIYDDIIANLNKTIIYSTEHKNYAAYNPCSIDSFPEIKDISYSKDITQIKGGWRGNAAATAYASITVYGKQDGFHNCIRYITSYSPETYYHSDYGYAADAQVGIRSFIPYSLGDYGHCDYRLGVAIKGFSYSPSLTISWNGYSFSLPIGSSATLRTTGKYVTPEDLH